MSNEPISRYIPNEPGYSAAGFGFGFSAERDSDGTMVPSGLATITGRGFVIPSPSNSGYLAVEGDVVYNVIGWKDSELNSAADLRLHFAGGGHFIDVHGTGCAPYTGLSVELDAQARQNREDALSAYIGPESGVACKTRRLLLMVSPTVGYGGYGRNYYMVTRRNDDGEEKTEDKPLYGVNAIGYGAVARVGLRDSFYASAYFHYLPTDEGRENTTTVVGGVFDARMTENWNVAAVGQFERFQADDEVPEDVFAWSARVLFVRQFDLE